ncbi:YihY family inner membrane protein [Limnohabitans sp. 103DPR2]|uniref:YihY family inner membrane protein n=1 Tax=Limnohabitans sp. 103DPR2 TaxID=1678129 RepID=UPI0006DCE3BA|nr:YihY family inner membrane protein [Limnohabitans sp. 103DPR2]ALK92664.1 ribonuclease BN/unknown domain fusion protein [Limnohabitans sp. 103DPR2]
MNPIESLRAALNELMQFPWQPMGRTLWSRFREVRLGMTASSLTFTTVLALVPLFTLGLAIFTAFPIFAKVQDQLQRWLIDSLVPESISRQVLGSLTQFSKKANRLGLVGLIAVVMTSLALLVTIDRTLGQIWRVNRPRPWGQRVLIYWAGLTLGPLLLGGSLAISSYLFTGYLSDYADWLPVTVRSLLDLVEFGLLAATVTGLYYYLPNTRVDWRHALTGGLAVALGLELAKNLLAIYLAQMPTYSAIYGAFSAVPILLVWIYVAWVVVLLGAVLTASLPEIGRQAKRPVDGPGWSFRLALETLGLLRDARVNSPQGLRLIEMASQLKIEHRHAIRVMDALHELGWAGRIEQADAKTDSAWVLLIDLSTTPLAPLAEKLWLAHPSEADVIWQKTHLDQLTVADVIKT